MFAAAQDRLARNRAWSPRKTKGDYLLRRRASCRRCGRAERVGNNGRYAYSRCVPRPGDPANGHAERCRGQSLPTDILDAAVWADLGQVLTDPAVLAVAVRRAQAGWLSDDARTARQHELQQRRATLDRQRQRLIDAYTAEAITLEELQSRVRSLDARLADLAREEQQVAASAEQQAQIAVLATRVEAFRASIIQGLDQATFARRRELVELLIDRVLVDGDQVEIRYIIPFGGTTDRKVALQSGHLAVLCPRQRGNLIRSPCWYSASPRLPSARARSPPSPSAPRSVRHAAKAAMAPARSPTSYAAPPRVLRARTAPSRSSASR